MSDGHYLTIGQSSISTDKKIQITIISSITVKQGCSNHCNFFNYNNLIIESYLFWTAQNFWQLFGYYSEKLLALAALLANASFPPEKR